MAALRIGSRSTSRHVERRVLTAPRRELATAKLPASLFSALDTFTDRHIGPDNAEAAYMLSKLGYSSMDAFVDEAVPPKIRIPVDAICDKAIGPLSEAELLRRAKLLGAENKPFKSYIGMGYHNAVVPPVILRNVGLFGRIARNSVSSRCLGYGKSRMVYPVYAVSSRACPRQVA
jgi:glycine dehydrogenase